VRDWTSSWTAGMRVDRRHDHMVDVRRGEPGVGDGGLEGALVGRTRSAVSSLNLPASASRRGAWGPRTCGDEGQVDSGLLDRRQLDLAFSEASFRRLHGILSFERSTPSVSLKVLRASPLTFSSQSSPPSLVFPESTSPRRRRRRSRALTRRTCQPPRSKTSTCGPCPPCRARRRAPPQWAR